MLSMSHRAPGYRLNSHVPPTFSALSSTRVRIPSCRRQCSMYNPENPAPITSVSKRAASFASVTIATAHLQDRSSQVQALDPPATVALLVGLVVVTGAVQLAAVTEDKEVFHRPNPGGGGGRGQGDLRGVAVMHRRDVLEATHHHRNEALDAFQRWRGLRVGASGGYRHIQRDHDVGGEHVTPGRDIFGVQEPAVARLELPDRFQLVSRSRHFTPCRALTELLKSIL